MGFFARPRTNAHKSGSNFGVDLHRNRMGRARVVRRRRVCGNGCRAVARHLSVGQPSCTVLNNDSILCVKSSLIVRKASAEMCSSMHSKPFLSIKGCAATIVVVMLAFTSPFAIEKTSARDRVAGLWTHKSFDSTRGFPGELDCASKTYQ